MKLAFGLIRDLTVTTVVYFIHPMLSVVYVAHVAYRGISR